MRKCSMCWTSTLPTSWSGNPTKSSARMESIAKNAVVAIDNEGFISILMGIESGNDGQLTVWPPWPALLHKLMIRRLGCNRSTNLIPM